MNLCSIRPLIFGFAVCIGIAAGCSTYEKQPLNDAAVRGRLGPPLDQDLRTQAEQIKHPLLNPVELHPEEGLTPDEAAIVAVLVNPSLRAQCAHRTEAEAQLIKAGILPNPQFTANYDIVTGGTTAGTINAYGFGASWDFTSLISHDTKVDAARQTLAAANLDVAWQEWQTAEAAKTAVYDLLSLGAQLLVAKDVDQRLQENLRLIQQAVDQHMKTAIDLAAAEAAARDARAVVLQANRDIEHQRLMLNHALGMPPEVKVHIRAGVDLPSRFDPPTMDELLAGLESRRLDLLGLKRGYDSQELTLRAAVLDQFPRINLGFNRASDTTNVHTIGPAVTIDVPIFDRNQGNIAAEKATRQRLFDEYIGRVFDARADIATALEDIRAINEQIIDAQSAVPNLQHLVDVYRDAVDHGNADVLSYYEAWNNLAAKNLAILKLKQQLADNRVALEIAAGRYFPDATPPGTKPTTKPMTQPSAAADGSLSQGNDPLALSRVSP